MLVLPWLAVIIESCTSIFQNELLRSEEEACDRPLFHVDNIQQAKVSWGHGHLDFNVAMGKCAVNLRGWWWYRISVHPGFV